MKRLICTSLLIGTLFTSLSAQCEINNTVFKAGEDISYDLYFKFGVLSTKAGKARLRVNAIKHQGKPAYQMVLTSNSTGLARKAFALDDTLSCITDEKIRPLAYAKNAHEGKDHTIERQSYSYQPDGSINIQARRVRNGKERYNVSLKVENCTYDMMSIIYFVRTLNYSGMKKGDSKRVSFISGDDKVSMQVIYKGITTMEANNDKKYKCHQLTLAITDKAFENAKEAMNVWLSADSNCLPIRIDTKLKRGEARAFLKSYTGLRN